MKYITQAQLEAYTGLTFSGAPALAFLDVITAGAANYIDLLCSTEGVGERWFDDDDTSETRYFDGNGLARLYVDDLRTVTSLVASITSGNGITLVENTDFFLYPLNAAANGFPYEYIELINPQFNLPANSRLTAYGGSGAYVFYEGQRNIAITGKWGFNVLSDGDLPESVTLAALKICAGILKENIGTTTNKEITSESLGEYSVSFSKIKDVADRLEIKELLTPLIRMKRSKVGGNRLIS